MHARIFTATIALLAVSAVAIWSPAGAQETQRNESNATQDQNQSEDTDDEDDDDADDENQRSQDEQQEQRNRAQQSEHQQSAGERQNQDRTHYSGRERAALGVLLSEADQGGVQISDVVENSPAQRAGLRAGDEIRQIDGQQVSSYRDVIRAINNKNPDDQVQITIIRNGEQQQLNVALAQQQNVFDQATQLAQRLRSRLNEREAWRQDDRQFQDRARNSQDEQNRGDVAQKERRFQDRPSRQFQYDERDRFEGDRRTARRDDRQERLDSMDRDAQRRDNQQWRSDSQARDQWQDRDRRWQGREREERATLGIGVRPSSGTVWVTQVYQGSAAEQAGIRRGDQIVAIDGQSIRSYGQLVDLLDQYQPGQRVSVELNRDGRREQLRARLQDGEAYARQSQQSEQYRTRGTARDDDQWRDQQYRDADRRDRSYQSDDRDNQQRTGSREWEADRKATGDAFDGEPSDNSDVEFDNRDF